MRPGSEEYRDSEKYQFRHWDWDQPGNLNELIRTVNAIRRAEPALQLDTSLRFTETDNPQIIAYSKTLEHRGVLVIINLDPHQMQHGWIRVPLSAFGLDALRSYEVEDLLDGSRYRWQGDSAYVRLDPQERVAHILRPTPERA